MPERDFVDWVRPIAATFADDRRELLQFVRSADEEFWQRRSGEGWTNKQILAHLAGGNDQLVQTVLRAVVDGDQPNREDLSPDTDAENARRVAERERWPVAQLMAELERDGEQVQHWLAGLTEADRDFRPEGLGMTLGEFLRIVQAERHDCIHLDELKQRRNSS